MNWFKRFFCNHEVDLEKLDVPVCKYCGNEIPRLLDDSTPFYPWASRHYYNPILKEWRTKHMVHTFIKQLKGRRK